MAEKKYTLDEFRNYLMHCDSFGDAVHFLNDENIEKANLPNTNPEDDFKRTKI